MPIKFRWLSYLIFLILPLGVHGESIGFASVECDIRAEVASTRKYEREASEQTGIEADIRLLGATQISSDLNPNWKCRDSIGKLVTGIVLLESADGLASQDGSERFFTEDVYMGQVIAGKMKIFHNSRASRLYVTKVNSSELYIARYWWFTLAVALVAALGVLGFWRSHVKANG